ncbi:MAG TPA: hypothetical protein VLW55_16375 [Burkholderiaceae bacterium]|nr:hypothetical protein [Burkholderiaceae bacterium]
MLRRSHIHAVAIGLTVLCGTAAAEGPVMITNPAITLSADDVRDVYLGEKQMAGNVKLMPVENASAQAAFLAQMMKLDASKYATAWTKKSFRDGLTPPPVKSTDAEVIEFVKRTPGGVGYVGSAPAGGVNVVK